MKNSRFRQLELVTVAEKRPKKSLPKDVFYDETVLRIHSGVVEAYAL